MFKSTRLCLAAMAALLVLQGCATARLPTTVATAQDPPPPVAAAFRTRLQHEGRQETSEWRFWRSESRVQREDLQSRTGELWQRDGATIFHTLFFHGERRGVEFEQADLQMTGSGTSWEQHAHIVSPALLQRLRPGRTGTTRATPYQDYAGKVDGIQWRVRMRTDLMVPVSIEQRSDDRVLRIELIEAHPLAQAPWSPPATAEYGMVDFADLGDHERDPFVQGLQAYMGLGHGHAH